MFEPTTVLVYGTLKRGYGNHGVLGNSKFLCEGTTKDSIYSMYDGGFPFVSATLGNKIGRIKGELYLVEEENIMGALDRLEGVPYLYIHERVKVVTEDDILVDAIMYVASSGSDEGLKFDEAMEPNEEGILEWTR